MHFKIFFILLIISIAFSKHHKKNKKHQEHDQRKRYHIEVAHKRHHSNKRSHIEHHKQQHDKRNHIENNNDVHLAAKQEQRKNKKRHFKGKLSQRFVIPYHYSPEEAVIGKNGEPLPEKIKITKKTSSLKEAELPGAFGEEAELSEVFDGSGSGDESGSGSSEEDEEAGQHPFVVRDKHAEHAAHFGNNVKPKAGINPSAAFIVKEGNHNGFKGADKSVEKKKKKNKHKKAQVKNITAKADNSSQTVSNSSKTNNSSTHEEDSEIMKQIQNIAKQIEDVEKKNAEEKSNKTNEEKAMKGSNPSKEDKSSENEPKPKQVYVKSESPDPQNQTGIAEGFECPWVCYWTCHSYCPRECCNNPMKCKAQCREFCSPYCKDQCCAPGTRRLPKLDLNFHTAAETGKKDETKAPFNSTAAYIENSEIAGQLQAMKEVSLYAARAIGLPNNCPLFCPKRCVPGLCKPECCSRNLLQRAASPQRAPAAPLAAQTQSRVPATATQYQMTPAVSAPLVNTASSAPVVSNVQSSPYISPAFPIPPPAELPAQIQGFVQPEPQQAQRTATSESSNMQQQNVKVESDPVEVVSNGEQQRPNVKVESGPVEVVPDQPAAAAPTQQQPAPVSAGSNGNAVPSNDKTVETIINLPPSMSGQPFICPTPLNCPKGGIVDPDYCPPICRSSCIEQCPNECCPNYGKPATQPKS